MSLKALLRSLGLGLEVSFFFEGGGGKGGVQGFRRRKTGWLVP